MTNALMKISLAVCCLLFAGMMDHEGGLVAMERAKIFGSSLPLEKEELEKLMEKSEERADYSPAIR